MLLKDMLELLNPVVDTLAMLSPMTDMADELAFSPDIPEYNEPNIVVLLSFYLLSKQLFLI
jgi:hypothetical protein